MNGNKFLRKYNFQFFLQHIDIYNLKEVKMKLWDAYYYAAGATHGEDIPENEKETIVQNYSEFLEGVKKAINGNPPLVLEEEFAEYFEKVQNITADAMRNDLDDMIPVQQAENKSEEIYQNNKDIQKLGEALAQYGVTVDLEHGIGATAFYTVAEDGHPKQLYPSTADYAGNPDKLLDAVKNGNLMVFDFRERTPDEESEPTFPRFIEMKDGNFTVGRTINEYTEEENHLAKLCADECGKQSVIFNPYEQLRTAEILIHKEMDMHGFSLKEIREENYRQVLGKAGVRDDEENMSLLRNSKGKFYVRSGNDKSGYPQIQSLEIDPKTGRLNVGEPFAKPVAEPKKPGFFKRLLHGINKNLFKADFVRFDIERTAYNEANAAFQSVDAREQAAKEAQKAKEAEEARLAKEQEAAEVQKVKEAEKLKEIEKTKVEQPKVEAPKEPEKKPMLSPAADLISQMEKTLGAEAVTEQMRQNVQSLYESAAAGKKAIDERLDVTKNIKGGGIMRMSVKNIAPMLAYQALAAEIMAGNDGMLGALSEPDGAEKILTEFTNSETAKNLSDFHAPDFFVTTFESAEALGKEAERAADEVVPKLPEVKIEEKKPEVTTEEKKPEVTIEEKKPEVKAEEATAAEKDRQYIEMHRQAVLEKEGKKEVKDLSTNGRLELARYKVALVSYSAGELMGIGRDKLNADGVIKEIKEDLAANKPFNAEKARVCMAKICLFDMVIRGCEQDPQKFAPIADAAGNELRHAYNYDKTDEPTPMMKNIMANSAFKKYTKDLTPDKLASFVNDNDFAKLNREMANKNKTKGNTKETQKQKNLQNQKKNDAPKVQGP